MQSYFKAFADLDISPAAFKQKALAWTNNFRLVAYYDHNNIPYNYQGFENILAVSDSTAPLAFSERGFENLAALVPHTPGLLCGILSYDLKNQLEKLSSTNPDYVNFPLLYFFVPEIYFVFEDHGFTIYNSSGTGTELVEKILAIEAIKEHKISRINIDQRVSKADYINTVNAIRNNILEGDIYEMNYCIEFYAEQVLLHPVAIFQALNQKSPMPFSGYFKHQNTYLLCASPERFLKKEGSKLISQPIKGTIRRGQNPAEDKILKEKLRTDEKEIAENMMIMDLARNDLNKSCEIGSVQVEEMFRVYGFQQVFQMITTVTGQLRPDCTSVEAIKNAFPMGSMTGAPKIRAMELIDQYENTCRGLFSGSFGYFKPNGDFDFNVVIRSLQYNAQTGYLSFMVGSAITYDSDPEKEYEECLLKAQAMLQILSSFS